MRVIAGLARGRRLQAPAGLDIRPTSDRVRESVFNSLGSMGAIEGATVLDLFAGTGAMGIEAMSRGAAGATFVDDDREAVVAIKANIEHTGLEPCTVLRRDVVRYLSSGASTEFDLIICDPPYEFDQWDEVLGMVDAPVLVLESNRAIGPPEGYEVYRERTYGRTVVTIARRITATGMNNSPRSQ